MLYQAKYRLVKWLFPSNVWEMPNGQKKLYLTFDDGPTAKGTLVILEILNSYHIKATFFCVGNNVLQYSDIYQSIINEGHRVGNHTFSHVNYMKVSDRAYIENVEKAQSIIQSNLFRPPYIILPEYMNRKIVKKIGSYIVLGKVISGDIFFNRSLESCYQHLLRYTKAGDIILFHDNYKCIDRTVDLLHRILPYFILKGFQFDVIKGEDINKTV